ncbi:MAG: tyrosine-type recombinase/integrase [Eubacteriales bacterium]
MQDYKDIENLPELLRGFVYDQKVIHAHSELTVSEYIHDLTLFLHYITARRAGVDIGSEEYEAASLDYVDAAFMESITREEILAFFNYTSLERENKARTRARKLSSIKTFYKYLTVTMRYFENNPAANLDTPQVRPALPKFLTLAESRELLEAVKNDVESKTRERDYAIITLFLNCGMRLNELCRISVGDMDRELRSLRVLGKGAKERIIYLNDACRSALNEYLPVRALDGEIKDKNALFISSRHNRISDKTVQWMVYKYLDLAGLGNRRLSTHKLRHTAATLMYQSGEVDVRVLKDILGHEQLNTTQIYTHVSDVQMERAMSANPLSEIKAPHAQKLVALNETDDVTSKNGEITSDKENKDEQ